MGDKAQGQRCLSLLQIGRNTCIYIPLFTHPHLGCPQLLKLPDQLMRQFKLLLCAGNGLPVIL